MLLSVGGSIFGIIHQLLGAMVHTYDLYAFLKDD